jgi:hypothetical protein
MPRHCCHVTCRRLPLQRTLILAYCTPCARVALCAQHLEDVPPALCSVQPGLPPARPHSESSAAPAVLQQPRQVGQNPRQQRRMKSASRRKQTVQSTAGMLPAAKCYACVQQLHLGVSATWMVAGVHMRPSSHSRAGACTVGTEQNYVAS